MPYIKVISIGNSVAGCLKYIANPDKTEKQFYISSLNCSEDISIAEQEFCLTYQHYSHKNFYAPVSDNGKSPVKAFHIIQSFKAGECAADIAHKIGLEWVRSVFGKNFQAVICTHTDRENIHNHICLCPYDLDGIKFNSNKKSLERIRKVSDDICRNYGIYEMEKLISDKNHIPIQYWAVADMTDGSESKVISFTAPKSTIDGIKDGSIEAIAYLDEYGYVTDVYILPSLLQD